MSPLVGCLTRCMDLLCSFVLVVLAQKVVHLVMVLAQKIRMGLPRISGARG